MKAFIAGCVAAIVIGVVAAVVLQIVDRDAGSFYQSETGNVRL
jgi:hypothetical protein